MTEPSDLTPLDEETAALLRDVDPVSPPAGALERVQSRVHATLQLPPDDGGTGNSGASSSTPSAPASTGNAIDAAGFALAPLTKAMVAAFALGATLGTGATYVVMRAASDAPTSVATETPNSAPAPSAQDIEVNVAPAEPSTPTSMAEPNPAALAPAPPTDVTSPPKAIETQRSSRPARTTEMPTGSGRDRALGDENSLITRAQSALARGQATLALEALDEHKRRFRAGQFAQERDAMMIQALAKLGRMDEARRAAVAFRAQYPGSMLRRAVDAVVGDAP